MLFIAIYSVEMHMTTPIGNTFFWLGVQFIFLFLFFKTKLFIYKSNNRQNLWPIKLYFSWIIFCALRGIFVAENYWDFKFLIINTLGLFVPFMAFHFTNINFNKSFNTFYLKITLPLFLIYVFLIPPDAYGFFLAPISMFLLFYPVLPLKWKLLLLLLALFVVSADLTSRSNVIKFSVPLLLSISYYFVFFFKKHILEGVRNLFFLLPLFLFLLAISGGFNLFKVNEYVQKNSTIGGVETEEIVADSRTFIYLEVIQSALKNNYVLFGRSPARGNETISFKEEDPTGRGERYRNEVAILNLFTWCGIVGVVIYFLIFYHVSYLGVNRSNNRFSKILGIFLSFRFLYSWVEDVNEFNLNYIVLWMIIGLCYSSKFREMNDNEVKIWVRSLFSIKYKFNKI